MQKNLSLKNTESSVACCKANQMITKHTMARNGKVYCVGNVNGRRYRFSTYKKLSKENIQWVEQNWLSLIHNRIKSQDINNVGNFKVFALRSLKANSATRRELTNREYFNILNNKILPYFEKYDLSEITSLKLKEWQGILLKTRSTKTLDNTRIVLNTIFEDALSDGLIEKNPLKLVKKPRILKPEIKPFSLEEIKLILENANGWFKNFLTLAFFSGLRTGEMMALQWEDIDFENNIIFINKSMRDGILTQPKTATSIREIDMLPVVKAAILRQKELIGKNKNVFLHNNRVINYSSTLLKTYWSPIRKKLGFNNTLYQTRHSFASLMISRGEDVLWVSKMLGHSDTNITFQKYAKYKRQATLKRAVFLDNEMVI